MSDDLLWARGPLPGLCLRERFGNICRVFRGPVYYENVAFMMPLLLPYGQCFANYCLAYMLAQLCLWLLIIRIDAHKIVLSFNCYCIGIYIYWVRLMWFYRGDSLFGTEQVLWH